VGWLLRVVFRLEVHGLENLPQGDQPVLVVANHQSNLDATLLYPFLPGNPVFAINTLAAERWYARLAVWLTGVRCFRLDARRPLGLRGFLQYLKETPQATPVIFPEGRISLTGTLMKIYEGPAIVADKLNLPILPIYLEGPQFSYFTELLFPVRRQLFPPLRLTILPPRHLTVDPELKGRERRRALGYELETLMQSLEVESAPVEQTLPAALNQTIRAFGNSWPILTEAHTNQTLNYRKFKQGVRVLANRIQDDTLPQAYVGVLLPTVSVTPVLLMALLTQQRVPVMLNPTAGVASTLQSLETASVSVLYTGRQFVEEANLTELVKAIENETAVTIHYLEDLRQDLRWGEKLSGWWHSFHPLPEPGQGQEPAVVLFTSGTTGAPKGVVLSHRNILANFHQVMAVSDLYPGDRFFNALPAFHSFGLIGGILLPLLGGIPTYLYPTPLRVRVVPEMMYYAAASVFISTNTFLERYARFTHTYNGFNLRYIFAGGEKLKEETRQKWLNDFGVPVLEGYGISETSPVLALNTLLHQRPGTVGKLVPGIQYHLEPFEGVEDGGVLHVKGPNVMLGYLLQDKPGVIQPPSSAQGEGWFDTGDVVTVDTDGYVTIVDRAKRFAKVGGEMVPLGVVESLAQEVWPQAAHAAFTTQDPHKGEQVILVTETENPSKKTLQEHMQQAGYPSLWVPETVETLEEIPRLGSGKVDYKEIQRLFEEKRAS
jgi:acyl-[acyl-carrier-protein]-phospholipid O-acyltransferase/long-chain-fatty-acid--[acyl-carrier-protein] ligase